MENTSENPSVSWADHKPDLFLIGILTALGGFFIWLVIFWIGAMVFY